MTTIALHFMQSSLKRNVALKRDVGSFLQENAINLKIGKLLVGWLIWFLHPTQQLRSYGDWTSV